MGEYSFQEFIKYVEDENWEFREEDPATGIRVYEKNYSNSAFGGMYNNTVQKVEVSFSPHS